MSKHFNYIIIGAGSAGCILANKLSENLKNNVLLLEAGGSDQRFWIKTPLGYAFTYNDPKVNWRYNTEPDKNLYERTAYWPRGKVIGGSSSINAMAYFRGLENDFTDWENAGAKNWGWDNVLKTYQAIEKHVSKKEIVGDGPIQISDLSEHMHPFTKNFMAAAKELNWPTPKNTPIATEGLGYVHNTTKNGKRFSSADAFLHPIKNRKNLRIIKNATVEKIIIENLQAKGVIYKVNNIKKYANANKEIILSSGAIGSPQILQVSGIGNTDKLKNLGIDVVHELKGVGENLQDHLMFRPIYKIHGIKSLNKKVNSLFGNLMIGLEYIFNRSGPMTMGASQLCMFAKSDPSLELPDLQWHVQPMSMDTLGATKNHDFHAFTPTVSNVRPSSRGHVSIVDKDSRTYAKIKMNYLSTDEDRRIAAKGLKLTRKIVLESETFKKYSPEEYRPGININDDEELVKEASNYAQTIFHPVGTCKMGQDEMAVVDEKLKVRGIKNLRVIDA